ncbi:type II toxin-antitoxin system VapC family toxin [Bosea sp. Root483D1]|uniref:type II toxin-antitoxin system VapC family toxin n=1 Tax=Bosea sp. Root483D1 TaxID=1736544 RepID=UPI000ACDC8C0|nr:type II toxin-antitoxin system VapC family toxin [Bosea sp. Root483D1]
MLDTSALIWWANDSPQLTLTARNGISAADAVFVSAITAMELSTKLRIGKLPDARLLVEEFEVRCADEGFGLLPLSHRHGLFAGSIKAEPRDPFDRMLAAQAILEDLLLVSSDTAFDALGARRLW